MHIFKPLVKFLALIAVIIGAIVGFRRDPTKTLSVLVGIGLGYIIGAGMGIAALGTAISGAIPIALLFGIGALAMFNWMARIRQTRGL